MRKLAILFVLLPIAVVAESIEISGHRIDVSVPSGWEMIQETANDYYFIWATDSDELIALINIYAGEDLGMNTSDVLDQFDGDAGSMLDEMMASIVEAIEANSGGHELRFGSYENSGNDPAYFVSTDYYDNWDGIGYYNLDTMYLYAGKIFYMDAFCLVEKEGTFKSTVLSFIDNLSFH